MLVLKPSTVWPTVLSFVSITPGILIVYSPQLPRSQTTILDERLSIHCNSSCLYNRCGSTDVYVLYSRVHFYYLKIKDCVEERGGSFLQIEGALFLVVVLFHQFKVRI